MFSCLAIDIGAGSGRVIRGDFDNDKLSLEEIHRFENGIEKIDGKYRWDIDKLFNHICDGLKKCAESNADSIGIDTWGVDFVLLDKNGEKLELPVAYRDDRTKGMMDLFFKRVERNEVYKKTGIQFMDFNTLYQFMAMVNENSELLETAETFLMIPDYLNYSLTGVKQTEFTNVSTTQMMNAKERTWDKDLIEALGINKEIFPEPKMPGTLVGGVKPELVEELGIGNVPVHAVASHDTGSAIAATPAYGKDWAYISSGTWCLMGIESDEPVTDEVAYKYNLTNEGGVGGTSRILKNIMGLWIIRGIKNSFGDKYSYPELIAAGKAAEPFKHILYVNDARFTNPECMCKAIDSFCEETGQSKPKTPGEYIRCAEEGLALLYRQVLEELREVSTNPINRIHILGGGVNDHLMCQMAADATGLKVLAGPIEATAIGNLIVQAIALGKFSNINEARKLVSNSFEIKSYRPEKLNNWSKAYKRYLDIKEKLLCQ